MTAVLLGAGFALFTYQSLAEKAARDLRLAFGGDNNMRLSLPQIMPTSQFFPALDKLKAALAGMAEIL